MVTNEFVVSVRSDCRDQLETIAEALRGVGLHDVEVSRRFGLIMGAADPSAENALSSVEGVRSVRRGETYTALTTNPE